MKKKILLIGIDGLRPDAMLVAKTPNLDALASDGVFSWKAQTEIKTVSGPAWTSLLTGVHAEKHGVDDNMDMATKRKKSGTPTVAKMLKNWKPDLKIVAHSNWKPIITEIFETELLDITSSGTDKRMARNIERDILNGAGDFYFVQLDECDGAGHSHGYGPDSKKYVKKIEHIDALVGKMAGAVKKRPKDEEWLVCVVSDHGGNGRSHGGLTLAELTIVFIISGTPIVIKGGIPGDEETSPRIVDVLPTIATFLGIPKDANWDGVARGF
ncbi:MAG: alkaline phosphatase family protein [Promethearchaeota archaeon]